jgi:hypothetical protein
MKERYSVLPEVCSGARRCSSLKQADVAPIVLPLSYCPYRIAPIVSTRITQALVDFDLDTFLPTYVLSIVSANLM